MVTQKLEPVWAALKAASETLHAASHQTQAPILLTFVRP